MNGMMNFCMTVMEAATIACNPKCVETTTQIPLAVMSQPSCSDADVFVSLRQKKHRDSHRKTRDKCKIKKHKVKIACHDYV